MKYIIGNWKSNKNTQEVEDWFRNYHDLAIKTPRLVNPNAEIIICPPFIHIPLARKLIDGFNLSVKLGAQDISPFVNGAYTGAVSAEMLKALVEYVLIGHSERRSHFHEDDKMLLQKVERAKEAGLEVVYCIPDQNTSVPNGVQIIAYEPVWAIGTGQTDTPENADSISKSIKQKIQNIYVIYGGSVNPENAAGFFNAPNVDGVLPGGASLDPAKFWEIINASKN